MALEETPEHRNRQALAIILDRALWELKERLYVARVRTFGAYTGDFLTLEVECIY